MGCGMELGKLTCRSCDLCCQVIPEPAMRIAYCDRSLFCMWPGQSNYFNQGIIDGLLKYSQNMLGRGFIFVDFSVSYLRLFLDAAWIEFLGKTKMGIVLVCDRKMQALANYWINKAPELTGVIYPDDVKEAAAEKMKWFFMGRPFRYTRGSTLTEGEFDLLKQLMSGMPYSPEDCAQGIEIRKVYARKRRIEQKFGSNVNQLFTQVNSQQERLPMAFSH